MSKQKNNSIITDSLEAPFVVETERGKVVAGTDVGIGYKDSNEDRVVARPDDELFAVIDGMGGMPRGDEAAEILAEQIAQADKSADFVDIQKKASNEMEGAGIEDGGAVYLAARIQNNKLEVSQAGDAQLLVYSPAGEIRFQTEQERMVGGVMNAVQGTNPGKTTDYPAKELQQDDRIVLGTDGIWDNISPEDFVSLTSTLSTEAVVPQVYSLIRSQIEAGGGAPDNLSLILYHVEEVE